MVKVPLNVFPDALNTTPANGLNAKGVCVQGCNKKRACHALEKFVRPKTDVVVTNPRPFGSS